jgi:hypothetical protein
MPTNLSQLAVTQWHRWFAWHPGFLETLIGTRPLVWLQYVERRWTEGSNSGLGPRWIYRRMELSENESWWEV